MYISVVPIDAFSVDTTGSSNRSTAGSLHFITCTATLGPDELSFNSSILWHNNGSAVTSGNGITTLTPNATTSTLMFYPLKTSHAGIYVCLVTLNQSAVLANQSSIAVYVASELSLRIHVLGPL